MKKIRVGIIFGGQSAEHEVSLQSAKNIIDAIDKEKYEIVPIGITKSGRWQLNDSAHRLLNENNPKLIQLNSSANASQSVAFIAGEKSGNLINLTDYQSVEALDVIFPVLHGPMGEDGTVQGLLKLVNVPFVGPDVLGAAVSMDKDVMKRLFKASNIPTADFRSFTLNERGEINFEDIKAELGLPLFIKPANMGSSVGVRRVTTPDEFDSATKEAFRYDNKILIEEEIKGREIECSVLGNEKPMASVLGGIVLETAEYYSYETKYLDAASAKPVIPAELSDEVTNKIQTMAIEAFKALCCEGMARVDFFLRGEDEVILNEVNSIPGFTKISMYPKLWEASGVSYTELIDRLIQLAIDRFERDKKLTTSYLENSDT